MFDTLLIANRGEIACRIIRTARRLGLRTVAVYSDADADALHVQMADVAHHIGPAPAAESYLVVERILDAARRSGAQAIHPGYGFLAENAAFAEACGGAGITFIGPPPAAIRAMGGKSEAKALMAEAGVPLVPGYHGDGQDPDLLAAEAARIGFPVLIKASAGGGGKGMRVVEAAADFPDALSGAKREAAAGFGNDRVLIEKYLTRPRHVEIQVFADGHGGCVYLFERDCSIQRRHQKVVEEAPAPGLSDATRRAMGDAAVAAARAIGYRGAGTVEFLLDRDESFYFMEMNTRLQVEHPVTEAITGLDLVELQIREAAGAALPFTQGDLAPNGHAIEVRLYAEDPAAGFLPATGTLRHLVLEGPDVPVRIDSGVRAGDTISIHYDPMIAKLIVWAEDRAAAVRRLRAALGVCAVEGLTTNLAFLRAVAAHPAFAQADLDTRFIERHHTDLLPPPTPARPEDLALAVLGLVLDRKRLAEAAARASQDPWSPWHLTGGWRLNDEAREDIAIRAPGPAGEPETVTVHVTYLRRGGYRLEVGDRAIVALGTLEADRLAATLDGVRSVATWLRHHLEISVITAERMVSVSQIDIIAQAAEADGGGAKLTAPMPGKVVSVLVTEGASVARGTPLIVLEAMKMEHTIKAPADGTVSALPFGPGDHVEEGAELVGFTADG